MRLEQLSLTHDRVHRSRSTTVKLIGSDLLADLKNPKDEFNQLGSGKIHTMRPQKIWIAYGCCEFVFSRGLPDMDELAATLAENIRLGE